MKENTNSNNDNDGADDDDDDEVNYADDNYDNVGRGQGGLMKGDTNRHSEICKKTPNDQTRWRKNAVRKVLVTN